MSGHRQARAGDDDVLAQGHAIHSQDPPGQQRRPQGRASGLELFPLPRLPAQPEIL